VRREAVGQTTSLVLEGEVHMEAIVADAVPIIARFVRRSRVYLSTRQRLWSKSLIQYVLVR
jgi:hypothetical protein